MAPLTDASAKSLHAFVTDHVEPGARVITDAWQGYRGLEELGYVHDRRSQRATRARGQDPGEMLPAVHRVASLIKRWLLGTHQGTVEVAHLPSYIDEFVFPLQPAPSPQPRAGLLPGTRTRRRPRPGALSRPGCQPSAEDDTTHAAWKTGISAEHGPPASASTIANH
jgi:hypothetical protein